ncbi:MAG TPA: leucyl aminopeptidase [Candidatus Thioglobus sp.]|nr:leucyl aminopeptidase [Candidatus Thioglobus sp.]
MEFSLTQQAVELFEGDCAVVFAFEGESQENSDLSQLLELNQFEAKNGKTIVLSRVQGFHASRVIVVGLGGSPLTGKGFVKAINALSLELRSFKVKSASLPSIDVDGQDEAWTQQTIARILHNASYQVNKYGIEKENNNTLELVSVHSASKDSTALNQGLAIANGMALTRELGDMPPNICTPSYLAETAESLAKIHNLECEVLEESDMASLGMHSLLSVSQGSSEPGKLISLSYNNAGDAKPIVLVGKGVTFDTGGISLKPGGGMDEMKYDMCGAASVLGVMRAVVEMNLAVNLTVVVPTVENMPAHNASKPGDVVKSMSGQTIEILNTDAEGRLILCDALTYCEKFNPEVVIDIATLTGAVIVALGKHHSGVMANDQGLVDDLNAAGNSALDTVWQLPLDDEYDELLKSNFADMANIGGKEAGSVTAACFLSRFTKEYRWAHLDIAGTAWVSGSKKGATGRPVPLLAQYIINQT